ncbi:TIGR04452 family lipoprotein [Leptospira koniambonensis]|uniref:TIGR04452 family lipoprotein n=1 Tax=Leptospira koniambonensis TaxID=2484950 RepID=A0A4R9J4V5_9LEPT|nr:TIGR04452 family lipoprotein [Leptospira koniambonensis]TGL29712.1 TIGR04452 family lipoprotein [Leptospira koniambonensis]
MRILTAILFLSFFIRCSEIGQPNSFRGNEAKEKLILAAEIGDYAAYKAVFTEQGLTGSDLENRTTEEVLNATLINLTVIDLDSSKFYTKAKIGECETVLQTYGVLLKISSYITYSTFDECDFSSAGIIATKKK